MKIGLGISCILLIVGQSNQLIGNLNCLSSTTEYRKMQVLDHDVKIDILSSDKEIRLEPNVPQVITVKVSNHSGEEITLKGNPTFEFVRCNVTLEDATIADLFRGRTAPREEEKRGTVTIRSAEHSEFLIEIGKLELLPVLSSIQLWRPFVEAIKPGCFELTAVIGYVKESSDSTDWFEKESNSVRIYIPVQPNSEN